MSLQKLDIAECLVYISLVWLTLKASPKGGRMRWATGDLMLMEKCEFVFALFECLTDVVCHRNLLCCDT